jgi:hypothetical protein
LADSACPALSPTEERKETGPFWIKIKIFSRNVGRFLHDGSGSPRRGQTLSPAKKLGACGALND